MGSSEASGERSTWAGQHWGWCSYWDSPSHEVNFSNVLSQTDSSLTQSNVINIMNALEKSQKKNFALAVSCLRHQILITSFVTIPSMWTAVSENMSRNPSLD